MNTLDAPAERFFLRLCLRADDFGRYHGHHSLLKSSLFPLKDEVRNTDIPRWLAACEKAGLVRCYEVASRRYIEIPKFGQRIKDGAVSKFPAPPALSGQIPPNAESESESETKAETEAKGAREAAAPLPAVGEEIPLPNVLLTEAFKAKWSEYEQYRRRRALAPLLPETVKRQWAKLATFGHDGAIASIDQTMTNQWQGLFAPKDGPKPEKQPVRYDVSES